MISGGAVKARDSSLPAPSAAEELDWAAGHFTHLLTQNGMYLADMDDAPTSTPGVATLQQQESRPDESMTASNSAEAGLQSDSDLPQMDGPDAWTLWGKRHPGCEVTCNGGRLPLYGWWPCRCALPCVFWIEL